MSKEILFALQPAQTQHNLKYDPTLPKPLPFNVGFDGYVQPGPHTNNEEWTLIGFASARVGNITLFWSDFVKDPSKAIDLRPVFSDSTGLFWFDLPIASVFDAREVQEPTKTIKLTVEIDLDFDAWCLDYGLTDVEVPADVASWLQTMLYADHSDRLKTVTVTVTND